MRLRDLSVRYKAALWGSLLVVFTAAAVTASLIAREYDSLTRDLVASSASLGRVLARTLVTPLSYDDVWRVFEIVNSPFAGGGGEHGPQTAELVVVLDPSQQVYVSTQPGQYPMLTDPARANPDFHALQPVIAGLREFETRAVEAPASNRIYMMTPIVADGVALGTLVMGYSRDAFVPRLYAIAWRAGWVTLVVIAILLPASWLVAHRVAKPLADLARSMGQVGASIPDEAEVRIRDSGDEVGRLGHAFKGMLKELRRKEALEREVVVSERLAAIGRLSAGVAHEINNPLGGMLNAISTFRRHGSDDPLVGRTLSLLERGLVQIKNTVAALLMEARVQSHPLSRQDIEDTHTLVLADAHARAARFEWENDIVENLPLPSTLVRQILINLMLNALQAIGQGGRIACHVSRDSVHLAIVVRNDGAHIPQERLPLLFEPFAAGREEGHGLGLWVTYQIITRLGGEITVDSVPGDTRFAVRLPLPGSDA